jgi:hypothetical protein
MYRSSSVHNPCVRKHVYSVFKPNFAIQPPAIRLVFGTDGNLNVCILSGISFFFTLQMSYLKKLYVL